MGIYRSCNNLLALSNLLIIKLVVRPSYSTEVSKPLILKSFNASLDFKFNVLARDIELTAPGRGQIYKTANLHFLGVLTK